MSPDTTPPLPVPDELSTGFWEHAAAHVLAIARCAHCGHYSHPPGVVCSACLNPDPAFAFIPVSGNGTVRSFTVIRDSFLPGFAAEVPFVLVDVELDEQSDLRLIGRLVDGPDAPLGLGARVNVVFDDRALGVAIPAFALADAR